MQLRALVVVLLMPAGGVAQVEGKRPQVDPADVVRWAVKAPPLPKPAGEVIRVASVDEMFAAAEAVKPGGTILIADGRYMMPRFFDIHTDDVTVRGESGDREKVILD